MNSWHLLTPELPPDCGGVGHYAAQVANGLAEAGDRVSIYCPSPSSTPASWPAVEVIALPDRFGARSRQLLGDRLDGERSSRLLVQYVPAVFGDRGSNRSFCRWIGSRVHAGTDVRVMFHEPYLYLQWRPDHLRTAFVQRSMARILLEAAPTVYLSTDTWRRYLTPYGAGPIARAITLPIPSAIPYVDEPAAARSVRARAIGDGDFLIGHFGTYGRHIAPLLRRIVYDVLSSDSRVTMICTGAGSDAFVAAIEAETPAFENRLTASGRGSARDISLALQACDVVVQPYPDGVTTRRTSIMAGLANRCAVVSCDGELTESVWRETTCVSLAPSPHRMGAAVHELLADRDGRTALRERARATYASRFDLRHTIDALLETEAPARVSVGN
jgi:glycosyltransferase involved in cell wall biosynthesis